jgi:hypothetical protein
MGLNNLAIQIGLTFFLSLFPFLCCIGAFETIIDKLTPIREVFERWTLDKQTNVKMIASQMERKIE